MVFPPSPRFWCLQRIKILHVIPTDAVSATLSGDWFWRSPSTIATRRNLCFVVVITVQDRICQQTNRVCYGIVKKLRLALPITTLYASVTIARRKAVLIKHLPNKI